MFRRSDPGLRDGAATGMTSASPPALLEGINVSVTYEVARRRWRAGHEPDFPAVDNVTLRVVAGETLALVGESGSGKTTVAHALCRAIPRRSATITGCIRFESRDITNVEGSELRALRRQVQAIYQDPYEALDSRLRVADILDEPLRIHGIGGKKKDRVVLAAKALEDVGLAPGGDYLRRFPHQMSGGQRQRVAIAASLVLRPRVLVADEPVSMLDFAVRGGILRLLDSFRAQGVGILLITHDLGVAAHYSTRVAIMFRGRVVEEGPTSEVMHQARHPYTRALLAAVPSANPQSSRHSYRARRDPSGSGASCGCMYTRSCDWADDMCGATVPRLVPLMQSKAEHRIACHHAREL